MEVGRLEETVRSKGRAAARSHISVDRHRNSVDAAEGTAVRRAALGGPDAARPRRHQHWRRHASQHPLRRAGTRRQQLDLRRDRRDRRQTPGRTAPPGLIISSESIAEFRVGSTIYSADPAPGLAGRYGSSRRPARTSSAAPSTTSFATTAFDALPFGTIGDQPPFPLNQFGANTRRPDRATAYVLLRELRGSAPAADPELHAIRAQRGVSKPLSFPRLAAVVAAVARRHSLARRTRPSTNGTWNRNSRPTKIRPLFGSTTTFPTRRRSSARYNFDNADIISPTDTGFTANQAASVGISPLQFQKIFQRDRRQRVKVWLQRFVP